MDTRRFDRIARHVADHRLSRRAALAGGTGGLATAALGSAGLRVAAAQDATPDATPAPHGAMDRTYFLFVQTFAGGTLAPHPTEADLYTLTLTEGQDQTVYFSDRPERIVGAVPTTRFLDSLGFTPDNPPNAALVAQTEGGGEEIVVLELLNPVYEERFEPEAAVTLTYDVRVLADYAEEGLAHLAERRGDAAPPEAFGSASLFIDECSDRVVGCDAPGRWPSSPRVGDIGAQDFCWQWSEVRCTPCNPGQYYIDLCNGNVAACEGACNSIEWVA